MQFTEEHADFAYQPVVMYVTHTQDATVGLRSRSTFTLPPLPGQTDRPPFSTNCHSLGV